MVFVLVFVKKSYLCTAKYKEKAMTPIFRREEGFVFKIYSNEEERKHIHVIKAENEAKYWLEPRVELVENFGFNSKELKQIERIIHSNADDFKHKFAIHIGKRSND